MVKIGKAIAISVAMATLIQLVNIYCSHSHINTIQKSHLIQFETQYSYNEL